MVPAPGTILSTKKKASNLLEAFFLCGLVCSAVSSLGLSARDIYLDSKVAVASSELADMPRSTDCYT